MSRRQIQVAETIAHHAADFFEREGNGRALITVTHADISPDLKNVTIYFSAIPDSREEEALAFAKRARSDFRLFLRPRMPQLHIPTVDFQIDYGEKNRQRIDDLTR